MPCVMTVMMMMDMLINAMVDALDSWSPIDQSRSSLRRGKILIHTFAISR
jgi:hypothetical protein